MLENGGRVGGDEILALADADENRGALARDDDLARLVARDHRQAVGADDVRQRPDHPLFQRRAFRHLDQMGDGLGIGVAVEAVAATLERGPQAFGVLDDAVVHDGDVTAAIAMGMGIDRVGDAVRRPARVGDPGAAGDGRVR